MTVMIESRRLTDVGFLIDIFDLLSTERDIFLLTQKKLTFTPYLHKHRIRFVCLNKLDFVF